MDVLDLLDIDFYQVEKDADGHSIIHDNGYCYHTEDGYDHDGHISKDYCYRVVEFCGLYLEPKRLRNEEDYYNIKQEQVKQYIDDITEKNCRDILQGWLEGRCSVDGTIVCHGCTPLLMSEVTDETPAGWYASIRKF